MRKILAMLVLTLLAVSSTFAVDVKTPGDVAIGPIFSHNVLDVNGPLGGWGITGKIGGLPPIWGFNFAVGSNVTFVGLTADWWLYQQTLYAPWNVNLYIGPGFFGDFSQTTQTAFDLGVRIPFDLDVFPIQPLEIFVEMAPAFGISFTDPIAPTWRLQAAAGARFWF
jgi:hypothetical protein